jgi:hypothetical protein
MLKIVEYGLFAVSLLIVLALILVAPGSASPIPAEAADPEVHPKLPPVANR